MEQLRGAFHFFTKFNGGRMKRKIWVISGIAIVLLLFWCSILLAGWISSDTVTTIWSGDSSSAIVWLPDFSRVVIAYYDIWDQLWNFNNFFPRKGGLSSWSNPSIDTNQGVGKALDMAVSPTDNRAYVAYYYQLATNLKYATAFPANGDSRTIHSSAGDVGWNPSICFDSAGNTHISYLDSTTSSLNYIDRFGTPIEVDGSALGNNVGYYSAIAVTGSNIPLIAYYDQGNKALKLADRYGGGWSRRIIDSGNVGEYPSIATKGETFYISYRDETNRALRFACGNTTSWNTKVIDTGGDGIFTNIVVIPGPPGGDTICIVYQGIGPEGVSVLMAKSTNSGASFNTEVISPIPGRNISAWKTGTGEIIVSFTLGKLIYYVEQDITGPEIQSVILQFGYDFTNSFDLNLKVSCYDTQCGVDSVTYSKQFNMSGATVNDTNPTGSYYQAKYWLGDGAGKKYVYVTATDTALGGANISAVAYDTVIIDTKAPTINTYTINNNAIYSNTYTVQVRINISDFYWDSGAYQPRADTYPGKIRYVYLSDDNWITWQTYGIFNSNCDTVIPWTFSYGNTRVIGIWIDDEAGNSISTSDTIVIDTVSPSGSMLIYGKDPAGPIFLPPIPDGPFWNSNTVTLSFSATDNYEVDTVVISNYPDFSAEVETRPYPAGNTCTWLTSTGEGTRTVYVKFIDGATNISTVTYDTIFIDLTPPVFYWKTIYDTDGIFDTNNPGLVADTITYTNTEWVIVDVGGTDTSSISDSSGIWAWAVANTYTIDETYSYWNGSGWNPGGSNRAQFNLTWGANGLGQFPLVQGERKVYFALVDYAGNISVINTDTIIVDTAAPSGCTMIIDNGKEYTTDTVVELSYSASDNFAIGFVVISESYTFSPNPDVITYNLPSISDTCLYTIDSPGEGTKTIYVYFADRAGNGGPLVPSCVVYDTIFLDISPPVGTLNIQGADLLGCHPNYWNMNTVTLNLSATDSFSGVDSVVISNYFDFSDAETRDYKETHTWLTLPGQGERTVWVKYIDGVGNISSAISDTIIIDTEPPGNAWMRIYDMEGRIPPPPAPDTEVVAMSDTYVYTNTATVGIELHATDNYGIFGYWVRNATGGGGWWRWTTPYTDTTSFQLTYGGGVFQQGVVTCEVIYRDNAGNYNFTVGGARATDTITVDTELPNAAACLINNGETYTRFRDVNVYYAGNENFELGWVAIGTEGQDPQVLLEFHDTTTISGNYYPVTLEETEGVRGVFVSFVDRAGNGPFTGPPSPATISDTIILDRSAPAGTITLEQGKTFINTSVSVDLNVYGTDTWVISRILLSNYPDFSADTLSVPINSSVANYWNFVWNLAGVDTQYIYVMFEDGAGNTSTASDSIIVDVSPPYNDILLINTGAVFTNTTTVYLTTISALDTQSGVETFVRSLYSDFSIAETFTYTPGMQQSMNLGPQDETRTVYAKFIDKVGNWSVTFDRINVDLTPPCNGSIVINDNAEFTNIQTVTLKISALDTQSGLDSMVISNTETFAASMTETRTYSESPQQWIIIPEQGIRTVYVKFVDNVGNISGVCADTIIIDMVPPAGSVVINNNDTYTPSNTVTLTLTATDLMSPVDTMVLSNYVNFSVATTYTIPDNSLTYNSTTVWVLRLPVPLDGTKTVYVRYYDRAGNVALPYTDADSIIVDLSPPVGSVVIDTGALFTNTFTVALNLSAFDTQCGVEKVWISNDNFVSSCETYPYVDGAEQKYPWKLFGVTDETKTVYVRFFDKVSNYATFLDTIRVDITPPSGSVLINNGAEYSDTYAVVLTFSRVETQSGMKEIHVSNDEFWSSYETFTNIETAPWTLYGLGDGVRTVWVKYIDNLNQVSAVLSDTIVIDTQPPAGTVVINNDRLYTNSNDVILNLSATDNNKVYYVLVSNNNFADTTVIPYASQVQWTLAPGDETKTVWVKFQDGAGNISLEKDSDTIYVDLAKPSGTVSINEGELYNKLTVNLSLTAADTQTPVDTMVISDGVNTNTCAYATGKVWTFTSDGTKTINVWFIDRAGNVSAAASDVIVIDLTPPSGNISINQGDLYNSLNVNLTLSASDTQVSVDTMVISDGLNTNTVPYATSYAWTFSSDGNKTITARFIDRAGNISAQYSDMIVIDITPPSGTVSINEGTLINNLTINLTLSASDTQVSVDTMVISDGTNTNTCAYATGKVWTFTSDGTKTINVWFIDHAGNISGPASDSILVDLTPPSGTVSINEGELYNKLTVNLSLTAADTQTPVDTMVISDGVNTNTCAYATGKVWTFTSDGTKTINVWFIDRAGNVSAAASDVILVDVTPPAGYIVINSGAGYIDTWVVTISLSATDALTSVDTMVISEGGLTNTYSYAAGDRELMLSPGDGQKTVIAAYIDKVGNFAIFTDTIVIDVAAPSGTFTISSGANYVNSFDVLLNLFGSDTQSGLDKVMLSNDNFTFVTKDYASVVPWTLSTSADGEKFVYAKFIDALGHISTVKSDTIIVDITPPSGSFKINNGDAYVNTFSVNLNLSSVDTQAGVAGVFISNDNFITYNTFAYSETISWMLPQDNESIKTVWMKFLDSCGNVSEVVSDTIMISGIAATDITLPDSIPTSGDTWYVVVGIKNIGMKEVTIDTAASGVTFIMDGQDLSSEFAVSELKAFTLLPDGTGNCTFAISRTIGKTGKIILGIKIGSRDDRGSALGIYAVREVQVFNPMGQSRTYALLNELGDTIVAVYIPAGSFTENAQILLAAGLSSESISIADSSLLGSVNYGGVIELRNRIVEVRAVRVGDTLTDASIAGTAAISITISYKGIWLGNLNENNLRIFVLEGNRWKLVGGTIDVINKTVTATVNHLSVFRLLVYTPAASSLSSVIVYPNPYIPSRAVGGTLKFINLTANVNIKIYNSVGELVWEKTELGGTGRIEWNGKNNSGNDVAPGVYIYVITSGTEKVTGKIGLVR